MSQLTLPEGEKFDLDLGDEHYLQWTGHSSGSGERCGTIIYHPWPQPKPDPENWTPWCAGSVWFKDPGIGRSVSLWALHGEADEHLTLSPSILCGCGDHGYIVDGRWRKA